MPLLSNNISGAALTKPFPKQCREGLQGRKWVSVSFWELQGGYKDP